MGIIGLILCFLVKSRLFLLCSGVRYLVSNLARVFVILEMKVVSLLFFTVLTSACLLSSNVRDIRLGIGLDCKAGSGSELGNFEATGVEALIDVSRKVEASEVSSSKAQKVQLEIAK